MKRSIQGLVLALTCSSLVLVMVVAKQSAKTVKGLTAVGASEIYPQATPIPSVTPDLPYVVPKRPPGLTPQQSRPWFDDFSWQSFIAINWPAKIGPDGNPIRGVPDLSKSIGDPGPRVWESWKADYELFQEGGEPPSEWSSYDVVDPPCGISEGKGVTTTLRLKLLPLAAKGGSMLPGSVNQAMGGPLIDQHGKPARYEIHLNQSYYDYVRVNQLYLQKNLPQYPKPRLNLPMSQPGSYGVIEIKAAWREMTPADLNNRAVTSRYYITQALVLDPGSSQCRQATLGLVGLHIAHKTAPFQQWVWSTFEQVDNIPESTPPPTPPPGGYSFNNGTTSPPTPLGYAPADAWKPFDPTKPFPTTPNQVTRINAVPPSTVSLNGIVQGLPGIQGTVWQYYRLINTQWPIDPSLPVVVNDPGTANDAYPQGSGNPTPDAQESPTSPREGVANITMETYFQKAKPFFKTFGSSCMHCHYQAAQTDFSWVVVDMAYPRNPQAGNPTPTQRRLARPPTAPPGAVKSQPSGKRRRATK